MNQYGCDIEALRKSVIDLYNSDRTLTCQKIADTIGVSTSTVSNYLRYLPGYDVRGQGRKIRKQL